MTPVTEETMVRIAEALERLATLLEAAADDDHELPRVEPPRRVVIRPQGRAMP